ncbi:WXG100 family type VII secretion target [Dactylosporangium sp. CA-092794]|uniref:WXG100 family type VII secretion target n=1 Tax=Dactylosporangium sp. CA-092794 TaxID=3239929 RepID=UPI003D8BAFA3
MNGFDVDLGALLAAIGKVRSEQAGMEEDVKNLKQSFDRIEEYWSSPAGAKFPPLRQAFDTHSDTLVALLKEAVNRMQQSYDHYKQTEGVNTRGIASGK